MSAYALVKAKVGLENYSEQKNARPPYVQNTVSNFHDFSLFCGIFILQILVNYIVIDIIIYIHYSYSAVSTSAF